MKFDAERVHSECWRLGIEIGRERGATEVGSDGYWIGLHIGHFFYSFTAWVKYRRRVCIAKSVSN